jgi:hypothetical protein
MTDPAPGERDRVRPEVDAPIAVYDKRRAVRPDRWSG